MFYIVASILSYSVALTYGQTLIGSVGMALCVIMIVLGLMVK